MQIDIPFCKGVELLKCDGNGLFALNKPINVISHPNDGKANNRTLINAKYDIARKCYLLPNGAEIFLLNRLDSPTSGVILCANNEKVACAVREAFAIGNVEKTYLAWCKGLSVIKNGIWKDRIDKKQLGNAVRIEKGEQLCAETRFKILDDVVIAACKCSLIELQPITGRTHQLRWQCAKHRLPIIGDKTYGDFNFNKIVHQKTECARMMLHSQYIKLSYSFGNKLYTFETSNICDKFTIV